MASGPTSGGQPSPPGDDVHALPEVLGEALSTIKEGANQLRAAEVRPPPSGSPLRQFMHGFLLPFIVMRRMGKENPAAKRRWLKVTSWQVLITILAGVGVVLLSDDWRQNPDDPKELRALTAVMRKELSEAEAELAAEKLAQTASPPDPADATVNAPVPTPVNERERERAERTRSRSPTEAAAPPPPADPAAQGLSEIIQLLEAEAAREAADDAARRRGVKKLAPRDPQAAPASAPVDAEPPPPPEAESEDARQDRSIDIAAAAQEVASGIERAARKAARDAEELAAEQREQARERSGSSAGADAPEGDQPGAPVVVVRDVDVIRELAEEMREEVLDAKTPEERRAVVLEGLEQTVSQLQQRVARLEKRAEEAEARGFSWLDRGLLFWGALVSALYVIQQLVIWLARDYHDAISRDASLAIRIDPEDPAIPPRLRMNWKWLRTRIWRRIRGFLAIGIGMPLIWLVAWPFPFTSQVSAALNALWFAYWWTVFSSSKSARAWAEPPLDPWFLRGWTFLTTRIWGFRWWLPRAYGDLVRTFTVALYPPATCFERQPYAMAGLAAARGLGMIPVVKLVFRPFFSVACAQLIEERRAGEPRPVDALPVEAPPIHPPPVVIAG